MEHNRARVLVVGGDEGLLQTLTAVLSDNRYCVDVARTGAQAITKSSLGFYNIAIIDATLPDMLGAGLSRSLHNHVRMPNLHKILLAEENLADAGESVEQEANALLRKPVDLDELLSAVTEQLVQQQEEERVQELMQEAFWSGRQSRLTR